MKNRLYWMGWSLALALWATGCVEEEGENLSADASVRFDGGAVCEGPNPALPACRDHSDCAGAEVCVVQEGACAPSSCSCDEASGLWTCTADCGPLYRCEAPSACGPNPAAQECREDGDCEGETRCLADEAACVPSSCSCDEATGLWTCTEDCGPRYSCELPTGLTCGAHPSEVEGRCESDDDCEGGLLCKMDGRTCVPSRCECDDSRGFWVCTDDCNIVKRCLEETVCSGPNPAQQECREDSDCDGEQVCVADHEACMSSACECEDETGQWLCTPDCAPRYSCEDPSACEGPNPAQQECREDIDCGEDERCVADHEACMSSACTCDEAAGVWNCTPDCAPRYSCEARSACEGPNPAQQECREAADCGEDELCVADHGACVSSGCVCDEGTGLWNCLPDCVPRYSCQAPLACEGTNPAVQACRESADCEGDLVCAIEPGACAPSSCDCDGATGQWSCTEECGPRSVCQAPLACEGTNPAQQECREDIHCEGAQVCQSQGLVGCVPSNCGCDETVGLWTCTADCIPRNRCVDPPVVLECEGANPATQACDEHADCGEDRFCLEGDGFSCVPSGCECDGETGNWVCARDCVPRRYCSDTPAALECEGPNPAQQACREDIDCEGALVCVEDEGDCVPLSCECDGETGRWACTRDCAARRHCEMPAALECEGPNPAQQACREDEDCGQGERCVQRGGGFLNPECVPSSCECDGRTGEWACSEECQPRSYCEEIPL